MHAESTPLRELVSALKHDLGKYVAWTSANLSDEAWDDPSCSELLPALQGDILRTRTRRDGATETAWEVWARFRPEMPEPLPAELLRVQAAVRGLEAAGDALLGEDIEELRRLSPSLRAAQGEIRTALRELHRRLVNTNL